ncbi:uncharacterized protein F4822DRAFT_445470 [Hypoxylon trugodes]|uniref:uncharacterized protein n=1 Tax=Hypoxylon trugodes TaxID=326681 RepID=UPI0021953259|nr:uncharacterized protein F4822DRAFT_445470 [Hypoxylon trugodes]KAI1385520.1 hypothetical protein F4822DRAFT_445470 [Hypoxylon trugodes]
MDLAVLCQYSWHSVISLMRSLTLVACLLTMASARERVLGITELHELVLRNLPPSDLLLNVPRVSKGWKNIIDTSPRIQQMLFLRGVLRSIPTHAPPSTDRYVKNTIVARAFTFFREANSVVANRHYYTHPNDPAANEAEKRPLLFSANDDEFRRRWSTKRASWRKMLVSQPPITKIHWTITRQDEPHLSGQPGTLATFTFEDGLRVGDLWGLKAV